MRLLRCVIRCKTTITRESLETRTLVSYRAVEREPPVSKVAAIAEVRSSSAATLSRENRSYPRSSRVLLGRSLNGTETRESRYPTRSILHQCLSNQGIWLAGLPAVCVCDGRDSFSRELPARRELGLLEISRVRADIDDVVPVRRFAADEGCRTRDNLARWTPTI